MKINENPVNPVERREIVNEKVRSKAVWFLR